MARCDHNWEVVDKHVLPSPYEQLSNTIKVRVTKTDADFFIKKYICILKCSYCGKLDKTIESNPGE